MAGPFDIFRDRQSALDFARTIARNFTTPSQRKFYAQLPPTRSRLHRPAAAASHTIDLETVFPGRWRGARFELVVADEAFVLAGAQPPDSATEQHGARVPPDVVYQLGEFTNEQHLRIDAVAGTVSICLRLVAERDASEERG